MGFGSKLKFNIREKLQELVQRFRSMTKKSDSEAVTNFDYTAPDFSSGQNWVGPIKHKTDLSRPPLEWSYPYLLAGLVGYMGADLLILGYRDLALPTQSPPSLNRPPGNTLIRTRSEYNPIISRNLFNSDGIIPDPLAKEEDGENKGKPDEDGPAVPSTLPLNLVGTIVHANPAKSVATIEISSGGKKVFPYIPNDDMEGLAVLLKVERKRAIFRNNQTNRLEYIEIKEDAKITFGVKVKTGPLNDGEIRQDGNNFTLKRTDLDRYLNDLSSILQQARAVPNIVPGSGGRVEGFRIVEIQEGSLYEKLGLKPNDVLKEVNGELVDSPAKAMELYKELKNSPDISINVDRNGRSEEFNYTIR